MRASAQENRELAELTAIMAKLNRVAARDFPDLDTGTLERATRIKEWGRMARGGLGLGYGVGTLGDAGPGDGSMSIEDYERINDVICQLPPRTVAVLTHMYHISEKPNASMTAIRLGSTRGTVEDLRDQGLNVIYGATCVRIRMPDKFA